MSEIFTNFIEQDDVVTNIKQTISSGMWSGGTGTLTTFFTSSVQSGSSGTYYLDLYKTNPQTDSEAEVQCSVTYGHAVGSGSFTQAGNWPSKAIYAQYRNILLTPTDTRFTMAQSVDAEEIIVFSMQRARMRERMDPGNWELHLSGSGNVITKFIDDSGAGTDYTVSTGGRVYNIVSGSISSGTAEYYASAATQTGGGYGLFYPDMGIVMFNAGMLRNDPALSIVSGSNIDNNNAQTVYNAISAGANFVARREEVIASRHYFCRITNRKYNFSMNPTYFDQDTGEMNNSTFYGDPITYITSVGLYNDANELLAIAKLSQPLKKSFGDEAIIRIKLDF